MAFYPEKIMREASPCDNILYIVFGEVSFGFRLALARFPTDKHPSDKNQKVASSVYFI